jgi:hypothetical protein
MGPVTEDPHARPWRQRIAWTLALLLSGANLFLHLQISVFCDALYRRIGRSAYEWLTLIGIGGLTLLAAAPVLRRRVRLRSEPRALPALLILAAAGVAAQESLLVTNVELIHFPQFALLAALLLVAGIGAEAAWFVATLAGIADEVYQYRVLYHGLPEIYLDYNDMVLNSIGAAWAVGLYAAAGGQLSGTWDSWMRWRKPAASALIGLLPVATWIDPPRAEHFWKRARTGRAYHVLSLPEGILLTLLLWLLVVWLCRTRSEE